MAFESMRLRTANLDNPGRAKPRRSDRHGGFLLGAMAAFLVVEAREHALARGARVWCDVRGMAQRYSRRQRGDVENALHDIWRELTPLRGSPPDAIISGATGVAPWTHEEETALAAVTALPRAAGVRYPGSLFGHGMEASFLFNIGLAALVLRHGCMYPAQAGDPADQCEREITDRVLVTGVGHFRGEAAALLSSD